MQSASTTATMLDSPQKKIQDLIASAQVKRDPSFTAKQYTRSAQSMLNNADLARVRGDMETAFIMYLKATTIILEVVKDYKDFDKLKTDTEYVAIKKRVVGLISDTEKIRELLMAKYQSDQDVETAALATAAKANRPKPPPRPSKPEFLSATRYDGQAPISSPAPLNAISAVPSQSFTATPSFPVINYSPATSYSASRNPTPTAGLSGPMAAMSMAPLNGMAPPTTLASYKPLQPTAFGSSSPVYQPSVIPSVGNILTSGPIIGALSSAAGNSMPIPTTAGTGISQQYPNNPVPALRATSPLPSAYAPTSAPAAILAGRNGDSGRAPGPPTPQQSSGPQSSMSSRGESKDKYTYPLSLTPQRLLDYMKQQNSPSMLLIDVRMQRQYSHAHIKHPIIVNVEPPALRDGVSAKIIADQGLFNNPASERDLFANRWAVDLVIYYDQNTAELPTSGPLCNLFRALHDLEFERPLNRRPVLLLGGFDAWLECAGMSWVEGHGVEAAGRVGRTSTSMSDVDDASVASSLDDTHSLSGSAPTSVQPQNAIYTKLSRGGGINRHDGRIIRRNIEDVLTRDDGPESMMHPRVGLVSSTLPNPAYPPRATPYSNVNAASFPPSQPSYHGAPFNVGSVGANGGMPQYPPSVAQGGHTQDKLNRRFTIYDNHWNNFGASERPRGQDSLAPPIPAKIALSNGDMSGTPSDPALSAGPGLTAAMQPKSTLRPSVPSKPMRPLPPTPGMNDLKDYTKFGSGFSKIGGSQLGKTGLTNLGNTCFMNSVIQCLIATPPLSRYFLDGSFKRHINYKNPLGTQGKLADAFSDLIRSMWSGQSLVISPTSFRYAIGGFAPQFRGTEQHDSQEFLSFLLDGLHEDLKLPANPPLPADADEGSEADEARMEALPEYEASEIAWRRYLRRDNSIVVNLFQGQFRNRLCCTKCGKTSTTYNAFMYLSLPIKVKTSSRQPQTLQSCLNAFVEPEMMDGDNAWNCPHCKKARKATKQLTISRVPDVLLIQLKRFSSDGPFKNKIKAMVQYPIQDLDLTAYLPKRSASMPAGMPQESALYDLYAVSNHSGEVSSGHYTACVRGETPNSWINFDDSRVSPCDRSVAVSEHGYTLFYVRKK